ncbi:hypothetical protein IX39_10055 [Chryseobacterium formosense]|uniref:Uncharacterized protein n=1 Tax=Chryseobacterium formosense TaxID=236814 RepID=A0A085Z924_9FLAO|nr:hypothetical protein [Chryseobacterium formosense]KFF00938.1 hypothetical protein IX39_10055 [Chryseobacterium formosense]SFT39765.1 hypothetical protein SAMN05421857_0705 [Chryseobacterium formosense]
MKFLSIFKNKILKSKQTTKESKLVIELRKIDLSLENKKKIILNSLSIDLIESMLIIFENEKAEFSFYDPKYYPSTDPGAYFSYSFQSSDSSWNMTLGNHGWSGGIYTIDRTVIIKQIASIINLTTRIEIEIENVNFFSNYQQKNVSQNEEQNLKLLKIHS